MSNFKLSAKDLALLCADDEQDRLLDHALSLCRKRGLESEAAKDLLREAVSALIAARSRGDRDNVNAVAFVRQEMKLRAIDLGRTKRTARKHVENPKLVALFLHGPGEIDENDADLKWTALSVFTWLRTTAEQKDDLGIVFLLDAYANPSLETAEEYRTAAGLTAAEYEATRKRLATLIGRLPDDLALASREQLGEIQ